MSDSRRIPTPLVYRWRRFCNSYVPVVMFVACVGVTLFLWGRQAQMGNGIGAIKTTTTPVFAAVGGLMMPMGDTFWKQYDTIEKGEVVCMLDDALVRARMDTLAKTQAQLKTEIDATRAEMSLEVVGYDNDDMREALRHEATILDLRLELSKLAIDQAESQAEYNKYAEQLKYLDKLNNIGAERMIGAYDIKILEGDMSVAAARVAEIKKAAERIAKELNANVKVRDELKSRQGKYPDALAQAISKIVEPIDQEIAVVEAQIEEIKVELKSLVVRAPVSGVITEVTAVPEQAIQPGLPIITIASTDDSTIVSYVRQDQRVQPFVGMKVRVRNRFSPEPPVDSVITHIGPQAVLIPQEQLRDPAVPEWGLPVWIQRPPQWAAASPRPGQMIELVFPTTRTSAGPIPNAVSVNRDSSGI